MKHAEETLHCDGLSVGQMEMRHGVLCSVDGLGRSYYRTPRKADVALAQRVVAAVASTEGAAEQLVANITGLREK